MDVARLFTVAGLLGLAQLLQNQFGYLLRIAERFEIGLKFAIQLQGLIRLKPRANNHVTDMHGIRQNGILLQLFKRCRGIVVIHARPPLPLWGRKGAAGIANGSRQFRFFGGENRS